MCIVVLPLSDHDCTYEGCLFRRCLFFSWRGSERLLLFLAGLLLSLLLPTVPPDLSTSASLASNLPFASCSLSHIQTDSLQMTESAAPACGQGWTLYICPNTGLYGSALQSVATVTLDDVWAVGSYRYAAPGFYNQPVIEHWDGTQWNIVPSPKVGVTSLLNAVVAASSQDVWAVGWHYSPPAKYEQTLIEHWDGAAWSVIPSPNVPGTTNNRLYGAAVVNGDQNDIWAFGQWRQGTGNWKTLTMRWDGIQWSVVPSPNVGIESPLLGGVAVATNDVWAVGEWWDGYNHTLTMHWDGTEWAVVPSIDPYGVGWFYAVTAIATDDVWAVGYTASGSVNATRVTLTEHWDGSSWQVVPSPNVPDWGNELWGVAAVGESRDDIWAVGVSSDSYSPFQMPLSLHWDGSQWSMVALPEVQEGGGLWSVAGTGLEDVWAVGVQFTSVRNPIAVHWNGPPCASVTPTATRSPTSSASATPYSSATASPSSTMPVPTSSGTPITSGTPTVVDTRTVPVSATATATPTCSITFWDVQPGHTFYPYVRCLACNGIVSGYDDGSFRPDSLITRGQIAKVVSNAAGFDDDPGDQIYEDVPLASPFYTWINRLSNRGYTGGYPCGGEGEPCQFPDNLPYFRPFSNATRGQLAKIVSNAAGIVGTPTGLFYTDVPKDHPFYVWIMRLTNLGVMSGYPCGGPEEPCDDQNRPYFRPYNDVTRGQASKIVANAFFPDCHVISR